MNWGTILKNIGSVEDAIRDDKQETRTAVGKLIKMPKEISGNTQLKWDYRKRILKESMETIA